MTALEICRSIRACWDALFLPRLVSHLETENASLRAKIGWFEQQLPTRLMPSFGDAHLQTDWSKIPQSVGGTAGFWDAEARKKARKDLFPDEKKEESTQ